MLRLNRTCCFLLHSAATRWTNCMVYSRCYLYIEE